MLDVIRHSFQSDQNFIQIKLNQNKDFQSKWVNNVTLNDFLVACKHS